MTTMILPQGLSPAMFDRALRELRSIVGDEAVFATDNDRDTYRDAFSPGHDPVCLPSAAVSVSAREQVVEVLKLANRHALPVWPVSRGKNLTYGGSAPRLSGSLVLDMTRMNRIDKVDEELAYAVLEPGVGFYDLHDHLHEHGSRLWLSCPVQAWGSVIGNALDRGLGLTPYGDHAQQLCGLEVVLPRGDVMRTGFSGGQQSRVGHVYKSGFGPGLEQLFCQSNFGVVTQAGVWLTPAPKASLSFRCQAPRDDDLGSVLDTLLPLRRQGVIAQYMSVVNSTLIAASIGPRSTFYEGEGAAPASVQDKIREHYGLGWWNFDIVLQGEPEIVEAEASVVRRALTRNARISFTESTWQHGGSGQSPEPTPDVSALQMVNWYGGRGGHMDFAPVFEGTRAAAQAHFTRVRKRFAEADLDECFAFHLGQRHIIGVAPVLFNRDDAAQIARVEHMFNQMQDDAAEADAFLYRAHLRKMDRAAAKLGFNEHALGHFYEQLKDSLDPNGILAPGKSGIWPARLRDQRGVL